MPTLHYDDVAIGDALPTLRKGPVTLTDLVKYSGASGDFNPLHTVPDYAKQRAGLPDVIAHGMLSMAYAGQLVTDWIGPTGDLKRLKAQFRAMTFLGDEVTCEGIVADKQQTRDGNLVEINVVLTAGREGRQTVLGHATVSLPARAKRRATTKTPAATTSSARRGPARKAPKKAPTGSKKSQRPAKRAPAKKKTTRRPATTKSAGGRKRGTKRPAARRR